MLGRIALWLIGIVIVLLVAVLAARSYTPARDVPASSPFDGRALYESIETYAGLGPHRAGGPGDQASADWLAEDLGRLGYRVERQPVPVDSFDLEAAGLTVAGETLPGFPLWWPPEADAQQIWQGGLALYEPGRTEYPGGIVVIPVPRQLQGGLVPPTRQAIAAVEETGATAIILLTETPSGDAYAFNTSAEPAPRRTPVLILGSAHKALLERALEDRQQASLFIRGRYRAGSTPNVIASLDRGAPETLVISTPRTGWFDCAAERGPGIALFRALARWAPEAFEANLLFVATGGHETGFTGMDRFMETRAPDAAAVRLWVHLGSSIAAYDWARDETGKLVRTETANTETRYLIYSPNIILPVSLAFWGERFVPVPAFDAVFGEAETIRKAGYGRYFAMAGSHPYFHTIGDRPRSTGPAILEPAAIAVRDAILRAF